ncbi:hypothetical protein NXY56_000228 [Leishmania guyanensis]
MVYRDFVPGTGGICMPPRAPAAAGPHRFAGAPGGFSPPACENFNLPPSSGLHPAGQPDTDNQFVTLGIAGFMLENAPDTPAYSQGGAESALDLAWPRGNGGQLAHQPNSG